MSQNHVSSQEEKAVCVIEAHRVCDTAGEWERSKVISGGVLISFPSQSWNSWHRLFMNKERIISLSVLEVQGYNGGVSSCLYWVTPQWVVMVGVHEGTSNDHILTQEQRETDIQQFFKGNSAMTQGPTPRPHLSPVPHPWGPRPQSQWTLRGHSNHT
jgi:hypothetical protein